MPPNHIHGSPLNGHGSHGPEHEPTLFNLKKLDTSIIKDTLKESAVGKRGEEWAWLYLKSLYGDRATVTWMNSGWESGQPYDIKVVHHTGGTQYIEVKATKEVSYHQARFVATHNELKHAREYRYNTEFYFVVSVQAAKPELYHVTNWNDHWAIRKPEAQMPKEMRFERDLLRLESRPEKDSGTTQI